MKKDIADIITVNVKKVVAEDDPYASENLYKFYIENTAGMFWFDLDKITLSYGKFAKELCKKKNESLQLQVCKTISHEIVHRELLRDHNIKVCVAFDKRDKNGVSFAEKLEPYGVW